MENTHKKIGIIVPIFNQEKFLKPFIERIKDLDKIIFLFEQDGFPNYIKEHGYSAEKDSSEQIVKEMAIKYPHIEFYEGHHGGDFSSGIYNEGLQYVQDCDIVLRLDTDFCFTDYDWKRFMDYIKTTNNDCYRIDFSKYAVNYYIIDDFTHGLRDALEKDIVAFDPHTPLKEILNYDAKNQTYIELEGFTIHHLKGWKKTYPKGWENSESAHFLLKEHNNNIWITAPQEIQNKF